jgi:glucose uptake protein GlcU
MPYMVVGTIMSCIGAGLLVTINTSTTTALSTAFLFIVGTGAGIGGNIPFTALQAVLSDDDMPIGNGLTVFGLQLGTSLAFAISQTVFLTKIFQVVAMNPVTAMISRTAVVQAGASHLEQLAHDAASLNILREAYSAGSRDTMIVALVAICLSLFCLPFMEWVKLPDTSKDDLEATKSSESLRSEEAWV